MSVSPFAADEIKSLEAAAVDLCGEHVGGDLWPTLYVSNRAAYVERYENERRLSADEEAAHRKEYAQAKARREYTPKTAGDVFKKLSIFFNNCNALENAEQEKARRALFGCVAFEVMIEGGPAVHLEDFANIRRVDFDHYQITTLNPNEGHYGRIYLIDGKPHPLEGFTTTDPREAFQKMWELSDHCALDYRYEASAEMTEMYRLIFVEGKTYEGARLEMLNRVSAAS